MSLTSFLANRDVRERFSQEFSTPELTVTQKILAPPLTNHYALVGTAFDYLLRFVVKYLNPDAIEQEWVSEQTSLLLTFLFLLEMAEKSGYQPEIDRLRSHMPLDNPNVQRLKEEVAESPLVAKKAEEMVESAKRILGEYLNSGVVTTDLCECALELAQVDAIYRTCELPEDLGTVDKNDIADLQNLVSIVDAEDLKARDICILNPTFGEASRLVGGADGDLVMDDMMLEIKTVKNLKLEKAYFDQLMGYYILCRIGGIDGVPRKHKIGKLGIYFSRYAYLYVIDVQQIVDEKTFPSFVQWFRKRAGEEYGIQT